VPGFEPTKKGYQPMMTRSLQVVEEDIDRIRNTDSQPCLYQFWTTYLYNYRYGDATSGSPRIYVSTNTLH
jgi:hypothetical protein